MTPEQEQLVLKAKALSLHQAQQQQGEGMGVEPVPEYEGGHVQAGLEGAGTGFLQTLMAPGNEGFAADQASNPRLLEAAGSQVVQQGLENVPEHLSKSRGKLEEGLASAKRAFPKTTGASQFAGAIAPYVAPGGVLNRSARLGKTGLGMRSLGGAAEGAYVGGMETGDLTGMGVGTAIGGLAPPLLQGLAKGAQKVGSKAWLKMNSAAEELMEFNIPGLQIPLSQALEENTMGRMLYNGVISNIPWAGGVIRKQLVKAEDDFAKYVSEQALPLKAFLTKHGIEVGKFEGKSMAEVTAELKQVWSKAYDDFNILKVRRIPEFVPDNAQVDKLLAKTLGADRWQKGVDLTGNELANVRNVVTKQLSKLMKDPVNNQYKIRDMKAWLSKFDENVERQLDPRGFSARASGQPRPAPNTKEAEVYRDWVDLRQPYANWLDIKKAGELINPASLAKAGRRGVGEENTAMGQLGQKGAEAMKPFPSQQGIYQVAAALGITAGLGAPIAAGVMAARVLAMPKVQQFLVGRTKVQESLRKAMESNLPPSELSQRVLQILADAGIMADLKEE